AKCSMNSREAGNPRVYLQTYSWTSSHKTFTGKLPDVSKTRLMGDMLRRVFIALTSVAFALWGYIAALSSYGNFLYYPHKPQLPGRLLPPSHSRLLRAEFPRRHTLAGAAEYNRSTDRAAALVKLRRLPVR